MDRRIAERRTQVQQRQRRRRVRRWVLLLVTVVAVGALVGLDMAGHVDVVAVDVRGAQQLSDEEVRAAGQIDVGDSWWRLSTAAVEERIEALPLVADVQVRRQWSRTVTIEVVERAPVAHVTTDRGLRGRETYVDRDGIIIDLDRGATQLPTIVVTTVPPAAGRSVDGHAALANAFAVWRGLSGPLRADVVTYRADGPDQLVLELQRGVTIIFGRAERIDEKVRAIGAVLADIGERPFTTIDVRAPSRPVIVVDRPDADGDANEDTDRDNDGGE